ncbi:MAG: aspartate aminotransferase family protein [Pseudomonadota bacterium]|nr:aspartate aminotransferase family protein [Pseudomonadota bacterium]
MSNYLMDTYKRYPVSFSNGEGAWLFDKDGNRYLDFSAGIAVNILGHNHPKINAALKDNVEKIWHVSNLYSIPEQEELAKKLCELSFADKAFFCNSGAEAVEGAIKIARRFHFVNNSERNEIITFKNSFHGRTLATIAASSNPKHIEGFDPLPKGFIQIEVDEVELERNITKKTAAILIEPIQGEGGINIIPEDFLLKIRKLCDENNLLMILDEVQCGLGRTGKLFAYEYSGVSPDIITIAKALGAGLPIGAILTTNNVSEAMNNGSHGSTFGGNPLCSSIASKVLDVLYEENLLSNVDNLSDLLNEGINDLIKKHGNKLSSIKGKGFMIGIECLADNGKIAEEALKNGLLLVPAANNVIRILPPLNIGKSEIEEFFNLLNITLENLDD